MNPVASCTDGEHFTAITRSTDDVDDLASCLRRWNQNYDQLTSGPFTGSVEELWFDQVQIFRERTDQSIHEAGDAWQGSCTFGIPIEVEGSGWFCGDILDLDSVVAMRSGDELDFRTPRLLDIIVVTTDSQALNTYAAEVEHCDFGAELRHRRVVHTSPEQAAALRDFLAALTVSLRATPDMLRHAAMRKALTQAIYSSLIAAASSDTQPRVPPPCNTRRWIVERAREYMTAHIDEPITVADLCVQFGVSRRTLQYSFQDVLDLNPVSFLRALRLNGVRRALKRTSVQSGTIADIAARWGFWHLSHFAADYKTMFGELPSETLRRTHDFRS